MASSPHQHVAASATSRWEPIALSNVARAQPGDRVRFLHTVAPLMEAALGPLLGDVHLFHTAVGFVNERTNASWLIEFDAAPSFLGALMPHLHKQSHAIQLDWQNFGVARVYNGIETDYWTAGVFPMATINGSVHNAVLDWLANANATHKSYDPWAIWPAEQHKLPFYERTALINDVTCHTFVFEVMAKLRELGVRELCPEFRPAGVVAPRRDFASLFLKTGTAPVQVSFDDPKHHKRIVAFYELIEGKFRWLHPIQVLHGLAELALGEVYLRRGSEYWYLQLEHPFVKFEYGEDLVKGCEKK